MSPADVLDTPIPLTWDDPKRGRLDLLVSPLSFDMEALIQRKMEDRALKAVQRHREAMSLFDYQAAFDGWRRDCASGVYEYGGLACFQWMGTSSGWCYRAFVMLKARCPDVTEEMVERIAADPEKFKELDAKIALANDPNRRRPAAQGRPATPGSPSSTPAPTSPASPGVTRPTSSAV
jgi:hypothetical protein